jgi:LytS/YehU family sensor histidine kinase
MMWLLVAMSFGRGMSLALFTDSLISMGTAGLLGIGVWSACRRWPWPPGLRPTFVALQIVLAIVYGALWTSALHVIERLRGQPMADSWPAIVRQIALGVWFYAVFAGISHAIQTRHRLQETEKLAVHAEALAAAAVLDALRARLNPHFLFNALHTLAALVRFRPSVASNAIEQLGDMLRYTLKEDSRGMVAFSEEFEFTRQYLAFEQLRYQDRLRVDVRVDPSSHDFDLPPFCIQTLAENAVHHAIATRPEGGTIWITCRRHEGRLQVSVRDDGPGRASDSGESHHFGLRSVRERLRAAFGASADLRIENGNGFQATFEIPLTDDVSERRV